MQISEFIKQSLAEIALGVAEAKALTRNVVSVSPGSLNGNVIEEKTDVSFELAVTTTNQSDSSSSLNGDGGFEISVLGSKVKASASGGKTEGQSMRNENASRISFSVPVYLNANHRAEDSEAAEDGAVSELREKLTKLKSRS